jgi:pimeloyl-ACP methyl ester carboxylesterase
MKRTTASGFRLGFAVALVGALGVLATIGGCIGWRSPVVPVRSVFVPAPGDAPTAKRVLVIFLPGSGDTPEQILQQGFAATLHNKGIAADVLVPDLHVGYYTSGRFDERLRIDIVEPMLARGYRQIWFAGISLGGFGSMMYARQQPQHVNGVVALAPFIASNSVLAEVRNAGGIANWNEPVVDGDWQRDLLLWLKGYADPATAATRPPLYVGYGSDDGFAEFNAAVGQVLPPGHARVAPGGHDWPPWKQLWGEFVDEVSWSKP